MQVIWISAAYNLFYTVGYNAYYPPATRCSSRWLPDGSGGEMRCRWLPMRSIWCPVLSCDPVSLRADACDGNRSGELDSGYCGRTAVCCPLLLMEYYYTVERVTRWRNGQRRQQPASGRNSPVIGKLSVAAASGLCVKSNSPMEYSDALYDYLQSIQFSVLLQYFLLL